MHRTSQKQLALIWYKINIKISYGEFSRWLDAWRVRMFLIKPSKLSIRLEYRSIATSRGIPAELGSHPSNLNVHEKKMVAPMVIMRLNVTNLINFIVDFKDIMFSELCRKAPRSSDWHTDKRKVKVKLNTSKFLQKLYQKLSSKIIAQS